MHIKVLKTTIREINEYKRIEIVTKLVRDLGDINDKKCANKN